MINYFRQVSSDHKKTVASDTTTSRIKDLLNRILTEKMTNGDHELLQFCLKQQSDSQGYYKTQLANLYKMMNQHGPFSIFRTISFNSSTWPMYHKLMKSKAKNKWANIPLENLFFYEMVNKLRKEVFIDLFGWVRFMAKIEFQLRG